jgi:predicted nucleic-acid-binding protein
MLGLDTNVLVRFLVRDDKAQFERAEKLIRRETNRGEPVFISLVVMLETEWVLRSRYGLSKREIQGTLSGLLESVELSFEDEASLEAALFVWKESPAEFADCLIGARHRALGCRATASFDARAVKLPGFIAA